MTSVAEHCNIDKSKITDKIIPSDNIALFILVLLLLRLLLVIFRWHSLFELLQIRRGSSKQTLGFTEILHTANALTVTQPTALVHGIN